MRSTRARIGVAIAAVVVIATLLFVIMVVVGRGPAVPGPTHPSSADSGVSKECRQQADRLGPVWKYRGERSGAAPDSPFRAGQMYVPSYPQAQNAAQQAKSSDPGRAQRLQRIAEQPRGVWFTDDSVAGEELTRQVAAVVRAAREADRVPTLVAYNIPLRDCGGYSTGGADSGQAYVAWVDAFVAGLRQGGAESGPGVAVILEPDALGLLSSLPAERQTERLDLLRNAVDRMGAVAGTGVYLDAGNPGWMPASEMADRLSQAGVAGARGFALNVSNFQRADRVVAYGRQISAQVGWKSFVVDTGRSGNGARVGKDQWCNPRGRALGSAPTVDPQRGVDAYLWVKPPGESDGECGRGDPPAGEFWPDYADELARNAGW